MSWNTDFPKRGMGVYTKLKNVPVILTANSVLDLLEENSNRGEDLKSAVRLTLALYNTLYRIRRNVRGDYFLLRTLLSGSFETTHYYGTGSLAPHPTPTLQGQGTLFGVISYVRHGRPHQ